MSIEELEQKGATTGLVMEVMKGSASPIKIQPNQTPTVLERVSYKAEEHIKSISGVSDSQQGFDREDVAAKAIAYKRQAGSINQTKVMDNLERTDYILARNCLDLIQQYYTEPRIVNIIHSDPNRVSEQVSVNQPNPVSGEIENDLTLGEYDITITSNPYRASVEDSQFEQARALREIGVQIPDSVLIENSRLLRKSEIFKQMEGDQNSPEAQMQKQLQMRNQQAEVANVEADANLKTAQAQRAQSEAQGGSQAEIIKMQAEIQLERERMEIELKTKFAELQMKQQELEMKIQMKQEEHGQKMAIKAHEAAQEARRLEEEAFARRAQELRNEAAQGEEQQSNTTS
jgi:hypothetical protein